MKGVTSQMEDKDKKDLEAQQGEENTDNETTDQDCR